LNTNILEGTLIDTAFELFFLLELV